MITRVTNKKGSLPPFNSLTIFTSKEPDANLMCTPTVYLSYFKSKPRSFTPPHPLTNNLRRGKALNVDGSDRSTSFAIIYASLILS